MSGELRIIPVHGIGEIQAGDDLSTIILDALERQRTFLEDRDILIVTQKIISKAEGRLVDPQTIEPSHLARMVAEQGHKDAGYYELVLRESRRIVKMDRGVFITETAHGLICANAGVDESNVDGGRMVTLLPVDSDASARLLRQSLRQQRGVEVAVIISDTFGRPWREGQVNVAIGIAGLAPLADYIGQHDTHGMELRASILAVADELASAGELVMGKLDGVPVALVRGYHYTPAEGTARQLIRPPERDLFR